MFTNISWADYFAGAAITAGIYYSYVGLRYYTSDLKELLSGRRKPQLQAALKNGSDQFGIAESNHPNENYTKAEGDDEFAEVEHLIGRLNTVIADASQKKADPQEFRQYLQLVLAEYPNVKNSPLRSSVNELIVSECEKYGAVTLTENEVDLLWDTK
ncbi:hypothetical protein [Mucilaginibacter polytrichastri]|uniref:Uncharacterized protein n=1 Tax=Mucilaginibacter polytrichastri TaxID=1302689 RepID=A0A1Q5ZV92_9SPHI|nr:hypothetical protein [Mucilaginibacter polytrichastri]OKS85694.1 hypothetical protein RG47T_1140 [Mucilaginibacter polytrichastri]SFS61999.1 hypothetical protein SAMN04487890_102437 [Mucilaginibacter polytrichastri]